MIYCLYYSVAKCLKCDISSIKIWDGVSNRCILTFLQAHDGAEVSSFLEIGANLLCTPVIQVCAVNFSRNGKYVLSSGKDSLVKLWELSTSRCLIAYTGAGITGKQDDVGPAFYSIGDGVKNERLGN